MQTMNTDQPVYYQNSTVPHQAPTGYFIQNPMGQPTYQGTPRMPQYYTGPINNNFPGQQLYYPQYPQNLPFVQSNGPRGVNPSYTTIIRPPNENPNGAQTFIPPTQYPNNNIYSNQYNQYPMQHTYTQASVPTQISNQSQPQYSVVNNQQITQSPPASQQSSDSQYGQTSQSSTQRDKRERKPLTIVDPDSKKPVDVPAPVPPVIVSSTIPTVTTTVDENAPKESVTNSTIPNSKSSEDINKTQIQEKFRQQVAQLLKSNTETDKTANQTSTEETSTENLAPQSTSSRSTSRSGSISTKSSEQTQPAYPGIRTGSIAEDKSNAQDDVEQQIETVADDSKSTPTDTTDTSQNETNESFEIITSAQLNDSDSEPTATLGKTPSLSKRFDYTIEELRNKRSNPVSQERPMQLPEIPGVTTPRQPKPKVDGDDRFLREVRSILNKLTPQTYDVLVTKLEGLELNSAKRLEGMIAVVFVKAVEAAIFCSLYAKLCKHFEKKQVTVPDENGQLVKHYFRQLLLSRCQKEFENDYRQEIRYEQRKLEVDAMTDEKAQREAAENLEEDFLKAKRKKLGNIIFIGELFKLHMLIDTIMYDCIEYLLKDKADEEGLECLCRLLRTIGKELETKASEKAANKRNLEKNFVELENIGTQKQTSSRIRFMIQDTLEQRKADWVARRAEVKPMTIDEIHETERLKREEQDRDRNQRRDSNRPSGGGGGGNPPQYTGRGSRGSGMKQPSNRNDSDRSDNRLVVNSIRQFQTNDKRNQGLPFSLAPQGAWSKGVGGDKKTEDDRANAARTGKPPLGANQQFRPNKPGTPPGTPGYGVQRQPSRELARESSQRDRENAMQSLRKTTNQNEPTSPKNISTTDSREGSRNVSREQSRNPSRESSVNERVLPSTKPTATAPLDEEKLQARVLSLIKEYTENYSENDERPVNEAIEDLISFCTVNIDQQGIIVRELFINVIDAKARARKAVGQLLDVALQKNIISTEGFLSGIKLFVEVVPDYAVDIPLIWQYIGEIIGALIGAPSSNMLLLKSLLPLIPENKSKQLFQYIIRYAVEFSSKATIQKFWQSANLSLNDLFKSDSIDSSFTNEFNWLSETTSNKENLIPNADPQLVKLFKSINDQNTTVNDDQILAYIQENMKPDDKFYIRKIVLSYLEACLIVRESQNKIQEDIAKKRMTVLKTIIDKLEHEIQAVYAIQNFVHKLEHPSKMARLLFDIFYDEECISEEAFLDWRKQLDPSEHEGHSVVEMSTIDFFTWLQQAEEAEEEEEE